MRSISRLLRLSFRCVALAGALAGLGCGGGDSTGTSPQPTSIVFVGSNTLTGTVGQALPQSLQIEIRDNRGNTVPNIAFTVTVSAGTIAGAPTKTVVGTTSLGTWTLGTAAGPQTLTVTATGLTPLVLNATAVAGSAQIKSTEGQPTSAVGNANAVAPIVPQIRVTDGFGNPIVGAPVSVEIAGGGSVQFPNPVTNANGFATAGTWMLGPANGVQSVSIGIAGISPLVYTVNTGSQYNIDIRFVGGTPPAAATAAFAAAGDRIRQMISGDLSDIPVNRDIGTQCFSSYPGGAVSMPVVNETIDDIVIFARITAIDGPGGVLGVGGPCLIRAQGNLPIVGIMVFDQADATNSAFGLFVLHEMLHAVGIGTVWDPGVNPSLTQGYGGANPIFLGAQARAAFVSLGGSTPSGVPLEASGGPGSAGGHWRQAGFFGNELMTAFFNPNAPAHPISTVTIAALGDFGYAVSLSAADQYFLGSTPAALIFGESAGSTLKHGDGTLRRPVMTVDGMGRAVPISR